MQKNRPFLRKRSSRIPSQKLNNPISTTLRKNKKNSPSNRLLIPLPSLKSPFYKSTDQQHTNLDLHIKKHKHHHPPWIKYYASQTTSIFFLIPKDHNNTSIPNSIQFQTSPITVEHLRDQNIALKPKNTQKTNHISPIINNIVLPNQTVEKNKEILPFLSHNYKSHRTLPVVLFPLNKPRDYTISTLPTPNNRRFQPSDRSRSKKMLPTNPNNNYTNYRTHHLLYILRTTTPN